MDNTTLKDLKADLLNKSANVELDSKEGETVIRNLKAVYDIETDMSRRNLDEINEIERRTHEENLELIRAKTERLRIESEERRSKRETAAKWGLGLIAAGLTVFGVMEDETRPALKNCMTTVKSFFKF